MNAWNGARYDNDSGATDFEKYEAASSKASDVGGKDAVAYSVSSSGGQSKQTSSVGMQLADNAPTIRSRVTVVCAECKRQKLKCDRRIPCESCTKRNTVSRCTYTPAAIEKVDVTSINNRLRVVEGSLNALGVPTPCYQQQFQAGLPWQVNPQLFMQQMQNQLGMLPTVGWAGVPRSGAYALPFVGNSNNQQGARLPTVTNSPTTTTRIPHILALANDARGASAVAPLDGEAALWLRECAEELAHECARTVPHSEYDSWDSTRASYSTIGNLVSSERLRLDLQPIDRELTRNTPTFGFGRKQPLNVKQRLAMHAGLGLPFASDATRENRPGEMEIPGILKGEAGTPDPISDMYRPLAAELLKQIPPRHARNAMLSRLGAAILTESMSCVPFRALRARIEAVCTSVSENGEGSMSGSIKPTVPSFSSIAEAAASLAIGTLIWASEPLATGRVYGGTMAGRGVRETFPVEPGSTRMSVPNSSSPSDNPSYPYSTGERNASGDHEGEPDRPDVMAAYALYRLAHLALSMHTARHGHAARDPALIHTYVLSAHYLLLAQSISADCLDAILPAEFPALVGTLVWEARAMGLGVDPDEFDPPDDVESRAETGIAPEVSGVLTFVKREDANECPEGRQAAKRMNLFTKEVRRRLWWSVVWLDLLVSDAYGYNTTIMPGEYTTRFPMDVDDTCFHPDSVALPPPDDSSPERNNTLYTAKLRLLEIAKRAPARVFRSGLVPSADVPDSATPTAAQRLADEIVQWLDDLPERYKLDAAEEDLIPVAPSPPPMTPLRPPVATEPQLEHNAAHSMLIAQRCDLAFNAYFGIMRLFAPKVCLSVSPTSLQGTSFSWLANKTTVSPDRQFVGLKAVEPALALVHAAQMQMTHAPNVPRATYHMYIFPRRLFDAAVVLAYVAIQQPLYTSPVVIEAVRTAIDILARVLKRSSVRNGAGPLQKTEAEIILEMLLKRAEKARKRSAPIAAGVKRKHDDVETETHPYEGSFHFPFLGSGIVNAYSSPVEGARPSRNVAVTAEAGTSSQHQTISVSSSRTLNDDQRSRASTNMKPKRKGNVPMVAIRQRVRDRRNATSVLDASRSDVTPSGAALLSPSLTQSHPVSEYHSQTPHSQYTASRPPSRFSSELPSASPISPISIYDAHIGARPASSVTELSSQQAGFELSIGHSTPQQVPPSFPSHIYPYPIPSLPGQSYSVSPLQHQGGYGPSMTSHSPIPASGSDIHHGVSTSYSGSVNDMNAQSDGIPLSFDDHGQVPFGAISSQPPRLYVPVDRAHQSHSRPTPWNSSESGDGGLLPQTWDTTSFMN